MRRLLQFLRRIKNNYQPLVEVLVYKDNLLHNLKTFQARNPQCQIAPVLKSNAYGHGLSLVAKILDKENLPFLIVDSYYEALILRNEGIKSKILIIGFTAQTNIDRNRLKNVAFTIIGLDELKALAQTLISPNLFHLKIDTGMHRQGILLEEINEAIQLIKQNPNIILEGICSHLADADNEQSDLTPQQIQKWDEVVEIFKKEFPNLRYYHLSATSGAKYSKTVKANIIRLGLGLYGVNSDPDLKPALEMRSIISSIKNLKAGDRVGYNATFQAPRDMKIATVPVGYFEGVDLRLSNQGFFKIKDTFCPIIGRVSMNITTIDVTNLSEVKINDPITIFGVNPQDKNSIANTAKICQTIPYEIIVHIPQHLRRTLI